MSYHIEYAKSGRSKCKGPKKLCHKEDRTIEQGEMRFGVEVESGSFTGLTWKHWTCVTAKVIENMKDKLSGPEEIEGFDSLRDEDAEKVRRAWDAGEIPEEDRPKKDEEHETEEKEKKETKKGGRKKKTTADDGEKKEEPKKRGRKRKNAADDEEAKGEEKPAKATKRRGRKKKTTEEKEDNEQASAENE